MAKGKTFADKTAKVSGSGAKMARIVLSEKKANGHYSFRNRMVSLENVKDVIKASKSK